MGNIDVAMEMDVVHDKKIIHRVMLKSAKFNFRDVHVYASPFCGDIIIEIHPELWTHLKIRMGKSDAERLCEDIIAECEKKEENQPP